MSSMNLANILTALAAVLSGTAAEGRGLLRWVPALWSCVAASAVTAVSAVVGLNILAAVFGWVSAGFASLALVGILSAVASHSKALARG